MAKVNKYEMRKRLYLIENKKIKKKKYSLDKLFTKKSWYILLFICMFLIPQVSALWRDPLSSGLVSYWKFDADTFFNDSLGINNGSKAGDAQITAAGRIGAGLLLDGTGDFVPVTTGATLTPNIPFSVSMWINGTSFPATVQLFGKTNAANNGYDIRLTSTAANIDLVKYNIAAQAQAFPSALVVKNWYHLVIVQDTSQVRYYLNGLNFKNNSGAGAIQASTANTTIGDSSAGDSAPFNGIMDEIGFWNRSLNVTEIADIYANNLSFSTTEAPTPVPTNVTVTLNFPLDNQNISSSTMVFNCSAVVNSASYIDLTNISLYTNVSGTWTRNQTVYPYINQTLSFSAIGSTTGGSYTARGGIRILTKQDVSIVAVTRRSDRAQTTAEICSDVGCTVSYGSATFQANDIATFSRPVNLTAGGTYFILYSGANEQRAYDNLAMPVSSYYFNVTGGVDASDQSVNTVIYYDVFTIIVQNKTDGLFTVDGLFETLDWNCDACTTDNACDPSETNFTLFQNLEAPLVSILYPTGNIPYAFYGQNITFNYSISSPTSPLSDCFYNYNGINWNINCTQNSSIILTTQKSITLYANNTNNKLNSTNGSWTYSIFQNNVTYDNLVYETDSPTYSINITTDGLFSPTAVLYHNGTIYTSTVSGNSPNYIISNTIPLPGIVLNANFTWRILYGSSYINTSTYQQNISGISFGLCNSSLTNKYINFSFKDETTLAFVNASIPTSTFSYWLGDGTYKKSILFINNTENPSYSFCFTPPHKTLKVDYTMNYIGENYPQRINNPSEESFNNLTTNKTLYLLSSSVGLDDTTQVLSGTGQVIPGVFVTVSREISGVSTIVAQGTTGDNGAVTFFLDPNFLHTYVFEKSGYVSLTKNIFPNNLGNTVTLVSSAETNATDCSRGVTYFLKPSLNILKNNTVYNFSFNITSSVWNIQSFGITLKNSSGSILIAQSASTNGGQVTIMYNTGNLNNILMDYSYYTGNCTANFTKMFVIYDDEKENGWSLKTFFEDIKKYSSQGIFGINNFSLSIIIFISIFVFVGIMSLRFGFTSPGAISLMIFAVVLFLDVGVGIIPAIAGQRMANLISALVGVIAIGLFVREVQR